MTHRPGTTADDDLLISLARQSNPRVSWPAIGKRFGMSKQAAYNRYKKIVALRGLPPKQGESTRWTEAQDGELLRRCDAGEPFEQVAGVLGRSRDACKQRYNILKRAAVVAARPPARARERFGEAERLRVQALEHDSLTAWFCGDPLPGRSALDQKARGVMASRRQVTLPGRAM